MSQDPVTLETRDDVTIVTMDDGKVNALSRSFLSSLAGVIEKAVAQGNPVVIAGNERAFSAGLDLKEVPTLDADGLRELVNNFESALRPLLESDVPCIAAVDGFAVAGGAILALSCDYRVGSLNCSIGATELQIGIPFPPPDMALFKARLPPQTIRRTIMDPNRVNGAEALEAGWIDALADDALADALRVASTIGGPNRRAFVDVKSSVNAPVAAAWAAFADGGVDDLVAELQNEETQAAIFEGITRVMGGE